MDRPWVRSYQAGVPAEIRVPAVPVDTRLREAAGRWPRGRAVVFSVKPGLPAGVVDYGTLDAMASRFAAALQRLGVGKGDRVAIMLPNSTQYVVAFFGALRAGAVVVNTNPLYTSREMAEQWSDAGAKVAVILAGFLSRWREVRGSVPVRHVIATQIEDHLPLPTRWLVPLVQRKHGERVPIEREPGVLEWRRLLGQAPRHPVAVAIDPEDLALLQYTTGTTGTPKAAMLSHRNLQANVEQLAAWFSDTREGEEIVLGALPFFHVYGLTVAMLFGVARGATIVAIPRPLPVEVVMQTIDRYRCTVFPGVPALYAAIVNHPEAAKLDLRSIKACLSGSAALPLAVQERFERLTGGKLVEGYGLSETSPVTHANPIVGRRVPGSIGLPVSSTDVRILALDGERELPTGEEGELAVSGPQVMRGYWNRPEETARVFTGDGFFRTGDIARRDEDGFFYVVDRLKDLINTGGFKVVPREVEEVLFRHPAVAEAVVIAAPDPLRGESVKAFVVVREGEAVTEAELIEHCRTSLAAFKLPRAVEFRRELPKTAVGKTLRRVLVAEEREKAERARRAS